jgi:hypothetical protein
MNETKKTYRNVMDRVGYTAKMTCIFFHAPYFHITQIKESLWIWAMGLVIDILRTQNINFYYNDLLH